MKERKYIKLRTDMYEDTKFKIIDMKPERDMIHFVWTRMLTLAGKVNMAGELHMSRNLPYTIETLAIEFSRDKEQVKLALDVFMELEMIEVTGDGVYRVKNFAKHQNIKVEEKVKTEDKEVNVKNIEAGTKEAVTNEGDKKSNREEVDKESENNGVENQEGIIINEDKRSLEVNNGEFEKENKLSRENSNNIYQNNITIPFEKKKNKKAGTKKKKEEVIDVTDEEEGKDDEIFCFKEGEYILGEGEQIIASWTF